MSNKGRSPAEILMGHGGSQEFGHTHEVMRGSGAQRRATGGSVRQRYAEGGSTRNPHDGHPQYFASITNLAKNLMPVAQVASKLNLGSQVGNAVMPWLKDFIHDKMFAEGGATRNSEDEHPQYAALQDMFNQLGVRGLTPAQIIQKLHNTHANVGSDLANKRPGAMQYTPGQNGQPGRWSNGSMYHWDGDEKGPIGPALDYKGNPQAMRRGGRRSVTRNPHDGHPQYFLPFLLPLLGEALPAIAGAVLPSLVGSLFSGGNKSQEQEAAHGGHMRRRRRHADGGPTGLMQIAVPGLPAQQPLGYGYGPALQRAPQPPRPMAPQAQPQQMQPMQYQQRSQVTPQQQAQQAGQQQPAQTGQETTHLKRGGRRTLSGHHAFGGEAGQQVPEFLKNGVDRK